MALDEVVGLGRSVFLILIISDFFSVKLFRKVDAQKFASNFHLKT